MSDGHYLIGYGHDRMHRLQQHYDGLKITLLASEPLTDDEAWEAFKTGEFQVYQAGELIGRVHTVPACLNPNNDETSEPEQTA